MESEIKINIVGAGLAGLSAAIHLAKKGVACRLISSQPSERAQSVLAEGGINGVLNTMGEDDRTENHFNDTMKAGCGIADPEAVRGLVENAPGILKWLDAMGVAFHRKGHVIQQRNFGGQKKKRTAYAESSTGKVLMTALIDEARKYEVPGLIERYPHHDFIEPLIKEETLDKKTVKICSGLIAGDRNSGKKFKMHGPLLMASGGLNGFFPGRTTGTTANTGDAAAELFMRGVMFSNLEMIQFHPTTMRMPGKRCLASEAARGDGGRLFIMRGGEKWYFMEEKYPELGNLMPRDVVSREEYYVSRDSECGGQVYLDCTGLPGSTWKERLSDLREEIIYYLKLDPAKTPIPVEPGIHYFMGGIDTDTGHRTNVRFLYAAGECCSQYHGANRLGGNSTMGAIYGGMRAAKTALEEFGAYPNEAGADETGEFADKYDFREHELTDFDLRLGEILYDALGIERSGERMEEALRSVFRMLANETDERRRARLTLAEAMLGSGLYRKESRGAHTRVDYPERDDAFSGAVTAIYDEKGDIRVSTRKVREK